LGNVYKWQKQHEQAIAEAERAIVLDPNSADGYEELASTLNWMGRYAEAIKLIEKAMRLNPHHPPWYLFKLGWAYAMTGRVEEAIAACKRVLTRSPDFLSAHVFLAAIYSQLGREAEARTEAAEVLQLSPNLSLEVWKQTLPVKDQAGLERFVALLRKAGLK